MTDLLQNVEILKYQLTVSILFAADFLLTELAAARMVAVTKPHLITKAIEVDQHSVSTTHGVYIF